MKPFQVLRPTTLDAATDALSGSGIDASILAGGTDILGEVKEGTASPAALVDITGLHGLSEIQISQEDGASIGSLVTISQIETDLGIQEHYPALAQSATSVATPQIRNVGTLGGNLCQRPRCWYYRSPLFNCLKKGGDTCYAVQGLNKYHAIFGGDGCHIVHPSDTAVALMALNASIETFGDRGLQQTDISQFFVGPETNILSETALAPGEIVTRVVLPPAAGARSIYLKAKERQAYDFALVSVAASITVEDSTITGARLALGGVAPVPYALPEVSDAMIGTPVSDVSPRDLGQLAVRDARPMTDNTYKMRLSSNLVARAVATLLK